MEIFLNMTDVARHSNGKIGEHPKLHKYTLKMNGDEGTTNATLVEQATKASAEAYLVYALIAGANCKKYAKLLGDLYNVYHRGKDEYPKMLVGAHQMLASWENKSAIIYGRSNDGIAFATEEREDDPDHPTSNKYELVEDEEEVALANNGEETLLSKKGEKITCYTCGGNHYANKYPNKDEEESKKPKAKDSLHITVDDDNSIYHDGEWGGDKGISGIMFCTARVTKSYVQAVKSLPKSQDSTSTDHILHMLKGKIDPNWVLLDNQSTANVFSNNKLLRNICKAERSLDIFSTARVSSTNMVGDLPGFKMVWYHLGGIANILSLASVKEKHWVAYDSAHSNSFMVERSNISARNFKQLERGLFYTVMDDAGYILLNTVADHKTTYSPCDYSHAVSARKLLAVIGCPSFKTF
eukprot:578524-Ditylum_brightwellii.AAC.1